MLVSKKALIPIPREYIHSMHMAYNDTYVVVSCPSPKEYIVRHIYSRGTIIKEYRPIICRFKAKMVTEERMLIL